MATMVAPATAQRAEGRDERLPVVAQRGEVAHASCDHTVHVAGAPRRRRTLARPDGAAPCNSALSQAALAARVGSTDARQISRYETAASHQASTPSPASPRPSTSASTTSFFDDQPRPPHRSPRPHRTPRRAGRTQPRRPRQPPQRPRHTPHPHPRPRPRPRRDRRKLKRTAVSDPSWPQNSRSPARLRASTQPGDRPARRCSTPRSLPRRPRQPPQRPRRTAHPHPRPRPRRQRRKLKRLRQSPFRRPTRVM